jgi:RNA polymerase sigma factor (sigma-70 family)
MAGSSADTSATLLARLKDPEDRTAWNEFVERYSPWIYQWCRKHRIQSADVDDLTQSVLLRLMRVMREFDYNPRESFRGWLHTVVRNAWRDVQRQRRHEVSVGDNHSLESLLADAGADRDLAEYLKPLFDREVLELAEKNVKPRFEPSTWEAYMLLAREGWSGEQVAAHLGMRRGAVYQARNRVQHALKAEIERLDGVSDRHEDSS